MSFLGGIVDAVGSAVNTVVHTAEDVVGGAVKVGEGVLHAGIDTVGNIVKNPLELLNPFAVLSDAGHNLIKDVAGEFCCPSSSTPSTSSRISDLKDQLNKLDPNSPTFGSDSAKLRIEIQQAEQAQTSTVGNAVKTASNSTSSSGGIGGLTTAMDKLGGQINDLMDQISKLDPKDPNYATKLASLNLQLQQSQAQFSQLENLASNLLKKSDDDVKTVERNIV